MRTLDDRILSVLAETGPELLSRQVWGRLGYLGAASSVRLRLNALEKQGRVRAFRGTRATFWRMVA